MSSPRKTSGSDETWGNNVQTASTANDGKPHKLRCKTPVMKCRPTAQKHTAKYIAHRGRGEVLMPADPKCHVVTSREIIGPFRFRPSQELHASRSLPLDCPMPPISHAPPPAQSQLPLLSALICSTAPYFIRAVHPRRRRIHPRASTLDTSSTSSPFHVFCSHWPLPRSAHASSRGSLPACMQ
jgi:hypothetical protein